MASLTFEGETHDEIVRKVKRWLNSLDGAPEGHLPLPEALERASELTKDALNIIAQAAPEPIARSQVVKALTRMGYDATENTRRAVTAGLDAMSDATEGDYIKRIEKARNSVVYEMNAAAARQILRLLK